MYSILVLGAFDRFNYGDLLFPYVVENALSERIPNARFYFYGLKESDLCRYGGKPSKGIRTFYRDCKRLPNPIVVIAGGESIGISWLRMFSFYNFSSKFIAKLQRFFNVEGWVKNYLGALTELPFTFSKEEVGSLLVIFNSLGESGATKEYVKTSKKFDCLHRVDFFSVRDTLTYDAFSGFKQIQLYPDSAILMSEFFKREKLMSRASKVVLEFIEKNKRNYLFFQVSKENLADNASKIASLCDILYKEKGISICLCPIGKAYGHEDQFALREIATKMTTQPFFYEDVNLWDIMILISEAKLYLGSSLHGVITSMSFVVPYIGIGGERGNRNAYIKTWGKPDDVCLPISSNQFEETVFSIIEKDGDVSQILIRDRQMEKINESFDKMQLLIQEQ